ncbi:hypothetical protein [Streptomyces zingiberis]|uniref:Uncharacterized protein n=1 Tax=Streptomyces zingiberis TaxID=2053010 RepID=A0ABX1C1X1_9ACTN|nr:hypothetical protein [Streptomyces zingiberis]NJQ01902.1 hypothetical protein [Streptomyces zingiberis]
MAAVPATGAGHAAGGPAALGAGQRTFTSTAGTGGERTTLRVTLDETADGSSPELTATERKRLRTLLSAPPASAGARPGTASAAGPGKAKAPGVLRCNTNPSWSDSNGTLNARFNCRHNTINWGYKISAQVKSIITSSVNERGVNWWRNGRRMPANAGHVVGKDYHFHGTLKPVHHDDVVQFQDYMTFRVRIGGRPGTGSITWAANVRAKR